MSTRGILAVIDGATWAGFEIRGDAYPSWAGEELVTQLRKYGLADSLRRIREGRFFQGHDERATPETHGDRGDLSWLYTIDPLTNLVRVYTQWPAASPDAPGGFRHSRWFEVAKQPVASDGRLSPAALIVSEPAVWPHLPVIDAWPEGDREAVARLDVRQRVARDAIAAGFTVDGFLDLVEHAISESVFHAKWKERPAAKLYVEREWTIDSTSFSVHVGGLELHYPPDAWSRRVRELAIFSPPYETVILPLVASEFTARLPDRQKIEGVFISALPSEGWFFALLDVLRARRVPDLRGEELARLNTPAEKADDWRVFTHADGRVWSIRKAMKGFQLRLGAPTDEPMFRERQAPLAEMDKLIADQLTDGFIES